MSTSEQINYRGVWLEVEFEYIPADGDGFNEPHEPSHCILENVLVEGVNITEILGDDTLYEIEKRIQP